METTHYGKVVAIDIDTESYIIADNALAASERLLKKYPKAGNLVRARWPSGTAPYSRTPPEEGSMITGIVNPDYEAVIHLLVQGPAGQERGVNAIIDTGLQRFSHVTAYSHHNTGTDPS